MSTSLDIFECVFIRFCLCSKTELNNIRRLFELNSVSYLIVDNQKWFSTTKLISNMAYHEIHKSSSHLDTHSRIQHIENLPLICSVCCWPCLVCAGRFRISRNYPSRPARKAGTLSIHQISFNTFQAALLIASPAPRLGTSHSRSRSRSHRILSVHLEATPSCRQVASGKWQAVLCGVACLCEARKVFNLKFNKRKQLHKFNQPRGWGRGSGKGDVGNSTRSLRVT